MYSDSRRQLLIQAYKGRAVVYNFIGDKQKACSDIERGINLAKGFNDKKCLADLFIHLADFYLSMAQFKEMLKSSVNALGIYKKMLDKKGISEALHQIGNVYYSLGKLNIALNYYNKSLKVAEKIKNYSRSAATLNNIGNVYYSLGKYSRALYYYKKSLRLKEKIRDKGAIAKTLHNIGAIYAHIGEYKKSLSYLINSCKTKEEIGDIWGKAASLLSIGEVYNMLSNYNTSLEYFERALETYEKVGDKWSCACCLKAIADIYIETNDLKNGLVFLYKSEKIANKLKTKELLCDIFISFIKCYNKKAEVNNARTYIKLAMDLAEEMSSESRKGMVLFLRAIVEKSEEDFKKSIAIFEKLNETYQLAVTHYYYSEFLISQKNVKPAIELLKKSEKFFKRIGNKCYLEKIKKLKQPIERNQKRAILGNRNT